MRSSNFAQRVKLTDSSVRQLKRSSRQLPLLIGVLTAAIIAIVVWVLNREETDRYQEETREHALAHLSKIRARVESQVNRLMFVASGLKVHVSLRPDIDQKEFTDIAKKVMAESKAIRAVELSRNNVISHVYPIKGNEKAIGLGTLDWPIERQVILRAMETRQSLLAGPIDLVQGGTAFICHAAIYETKPGKPAQTGSFWGMVSMLIDRDQLLESFELSEQNSRFEIALRGTDALGSQGKVFFGDATVFNRDAMTMEVTLPTGSWQLGSLPVGGWPNAAPISIWLLSTGGVLSLLAGWLAYRIVFMNQENQRLLHAILPTVIADRMKQGEMTIADGFAETTVLFSDIVGFTALSETMSSSKVVTLLSQIFCEFDLLAEQAGIEKIKTIGDAYIAAAGVPEPRSDHTEVLADMALEMLNVVRRINKQNDMTLAVRIGIASGPITAGVIGTHNSSMTYGATRLIRPAEWNHPEYATEFRFRSQLTSDSKRNTRSSRAGKSK